MKQDILHMVIAGQGGQGVNTLYRVFLKLFDDQGFYCKSAMQKGGAQRHGSVWSMIRVFKKFIPEYAWYSSQIPDGKLDVLLGLDPWEALRYHRLTGPQTHIWSNMNEHGRYTDRGLERTFPDPGSEYAKIGCTKSLKNYSDLAIGAFDDHRMANYLIGKDFIAGGLLPVSEEAYTACFLEEVRMTDTITELLKKEKKE